MEIHMCAVCACCMGKRGWERREVAALAPWRDEKPSKPGEQENTRRAEVKLPRPSETERERKIYQTFSSTLGQIVYVVKLQTWCGNSELLYMRCTFKLSNSWETCEKLPDCSDLVLCFVFHCMSSLTESPVMCQVLFYLFPKSTIWCSFLSNGYEMLLYSMWVAHWFC